MKQRHLCGECGEIVSSAWKLGRHYLAAHHVVLQRDYTQVKLSTGEAERKYRSHRRGQQSAKRRAAKREARRATSADETVATSESQHEFLEDEEPDVVDNIQSAQAEGVQKTVVQDDHEAAAKQGTAGECSPAYDERRDDDDGLFDDTEFCSVDFDGAPRSPSFFGQGATLPVTYGEAQPAAIRPVTPEPELTTVAAVPKLPIPSLSSRHSGEPCA